MKLIMIWPIKKLHFIYSALNLMCFVIFFIKIQERLQTLLLAYWNNTGPFWSSDSNLINGNRDEIATQNVLVSRSYLHYLCWDFMIKMPSMFFWIGYQWQQFRVLCIINFVMTSVACLYVSLLALNFHCYDELFYVLLIMMPLLAGWIFP